jgi:MoxR-like ATPase
MRFTSRPLIIFTAGLSLLASLAQASGAAHASSGHAAAASSCPLLFEDEMSLIDLFRAPPDPADDWKQTVKSIHRITQDIHDSETFVSGILTAMIAKEFIWINGDPGGAKTMTSRALFKASLRSIPEQDKRDFILQFHKLMADGIITGFPVFESQLKKGRYIIETSTSLVGDKYLFLLADEAENATPAVMSSLLSVLNERKAFVGGREVKAPLQSGVFTSNKTLAEFLESFGDDRPTGEATADRMIAKFHMPNQTKTVEDSVRLIRVVEAAKAQKRDNKNDTSQSEIVLHLNTLQDIFNKIEVDPSVYTDLAQIASNFDTLVTGDLDNELAKVRAPGEKHSPTFPANQFSVRSMLKSTAWLKAAYITEQLMLGKTLDQVSLTIDRKSLHLIASNYTYTSLSRIRPKRIGLDKIHGSESGIPEENLLGEWDPYNNLLYVRHALADGKVVFEFNRQTKTFTKISEDVGSAIEVDTNGLAARLLTSETQASIKLDTVEYELDGDLSKFLTRQTIPKRTRDELNLIQRQQVELKEIINAQISKPKRSVDTSLARLSKIKVFSRQAKELKQKLRAARRKPNEYIRLQYEATQLAAKELTAKFPGLEHYVKSIMVALASETHVYAFGPPGGAKTLIGRLILDAEIASYNKEEIIHFAKQFVSKLAETHPDDLKKMLATFRQRDPVWGKRFMLQMHKLLPEGIINGFPVWESQFNNGKLVYNFDDSLAARKFIVAIIDEVDKANVAVLTTTLSIFNEREVFNGSTVFKTGLRTAVVTSNKVVYALLNSFGPDRPKGEAFFDRTLNKTYVSNKMIDADQMAQLLYDTDHGVKPTLESPISLSPLRAKAAEVKIPDMVLTTIAKIADRYHSARLREEEDTVLAHEEDSSNPEPYIRASIPSNRTLPALVEQFKQRVLVEQMLAGVPYNELRTEVQISDIAYFFEGLGYWAPYSYGSNSIKFEYTSNGLIEFKADDAQIIALLNSTRISATQKTSLGYMHGELKAYIAASNEVVQTFVLQYRDIIARFPHLFPTLFGSDQARENWLKAHRGSGTK